MFATAGTPAAPLAYMQQEQQEPFPLLQTPGPWLMHLIQHCHNPVMRRALFRTNKQLKDLVLQAAPDLHLTLMLSDTPQDRSATAQLLATRGERPVHVLLQPSAQTTTQTVSHELQQLGGHRVTQLSLCLAAVNHPQRQAALLSAAAAALPNLTSLQVDHAVTLPPPAQLPHLTDLAIISHALLDSVAQYLPQLQKLHIKGFPAPSSTILFNINTTWAALTHLTVRSPVDDDQLDVVLQRAPVLQVLVCDVLRLQHSHAGRVWGVHELCVRGDVSVHSLANLPQPQPREGTLDLDISGDISVPVDVAQEQLARLLNWRFVTRGLCFRIVGQGSSASAILELLAHLAALKTTGRSTVRLGALSASDRQAVLQEAAAHPQLKLQLP